MKTFEEQFTAWVDGRLSAEERATFERELPAHPEAGSDRAAALQLGELLRAQPAPPLANADFFSHQLRERIARDGADSVAPAPARSWYRLPLFRYGAASAFGLVIALAFFDSTRLDQGPVASDAPAYVAEIIDAHPADPSIYVSTVHSAASDGATVLWLDGLDYVPGDRKLVSDVR